MFFKTNVPNDIESTVDGIGRYFWGERNGEEVVKVTQEAYEKIVFQKKNYLCCQLAKLEWVNDLPLKKIFFKSHA